MGQRFLQPPGAVFMALLSSLENPASVGPWPFTPAAHRFCIFLLARRADAHYLCGASNPVREASALPRLHIKKRRGGEL